MTRYDTNLAAEFHVLSCLHRLGLTANLTLGNKKGVDIVFVRDTGEVATVEVKGLASAYDWPADNLVTAQPRHRELHFVVLVTYEGRIAEPAMPAPRTWVILFPQLDPFVQRFRTRVNVSRTCVLHDGAAFVNAWHVIAGRTAPPSGTQADT